LEDAERPGAVGAQAPLHEGEHAPLDPGHHREKAEQRSDHDQDLHRGDRQLLDHGEALTR